MFSPIQLENFEAIDDSCEAVQTKDSLHIELYDGYDKFMKKFELVCNQHKFSQPTRKDVLKKSLPHCLALKKFLLNCP